MPAIPSRPPATVDRRKLLAAAVGLPLLAAAPLTGAAPAAAAPPPHRSGWHRPTPPVLPITIDQDGFQIPGPDPRPAGIVTFRVSTEDPDGYYWGLGRARRDDLTYEEVQRLEELSFDPDPAIALPALRELYAAVEYAGGAGTFGGQAPIAATLPLNSGEYLATAVPAAINPQPDAETFVDSLAVSARHRPARPPRVDGVIRMVEVDGEARFRMPAQLPASGTYLFVNDTSHPQEGVFGRVVPGTTDADVAAYFAALRAGEPPPEEVFVSRAGGLMALSPDRWVALTVAFPPGLYSVQSFYRNPETGVGRVYEGMHRVVELY